MRPSPHRLRDRPATPPSARAPASRRRPCSAASRPWSCRLPAHRRTRGLLRGQPVNVIVLDPRGPVASSEPIGPAFDAGPRSSGRYPVSVSVCSSCGAANADEARFCATCGAGLGAICSNCGAAIPDGARFCPACGTRAGPQIDAERQRKVISVVFADLVGYTSRSEITRRRGRARALEHYYQRVSVEIERFGGTVEKFIGDAVMAVFGAPVATGTTPSGPSAPRCRSRRGGRPERRVARRRAPGARRREHGRGRRRARRLVGERGARRGRHGQHRVAPPDPPRPRAACSSARGRTGPRTASISYEDVGADHRQEQAGPGPRLAGRRAPHAGRPTAQRDTFLGRAAASSVCSKTSGNGWSWAAVLTW